MLAPSVQELRHTLRHFRASIPIIKQFRCLGVTLNSPHAWVLWLRCKDGRRRLLA